MGGFEEKRGKKRQKRDKKKQNQRGREKARISKKALADEKLNDMPKKSRLSRRRNRDIGINHTENNTKPRKSGANSQNKRNRKERKKNVTKL